MKVTEDKVESKKKNNKKNNKKKPANPYAEEEHLEGGETDEEDEWEQH